MVIFDWILLLATATAPVTGSEQYIQQLLESYGPIIVFLALFAPLLGEEPIIVGAGIAIGHGHMPAFATWMCAYVGVICSDSIWYWLCYAYGTPLLHKRWFKRLAHPRRLLQAKHQMEKRGAWVIVMGRFLPGSRTAAVVMAGLLHMRPWKYYLVEAFCAAATVSLQIGFGYFIASQMHSGEKPSLGRTMLTIAAVLVGMFLVTFGTRWIISRRKGETQSPRAKASWLRKFKAPRVPKSIPLTGKLKARGPITGPSHTP